MTDNVTASAFNVNNDVTDGFSTGDIWRAASGKSPFHRGSEARHRRALKGLWKVYTPGYKASNFCPVKQTFAESSRHLPSP